MQQPASTTPTWVELAQTKGEAFDARTHKLTKVIAKLPSLALVDSEEELPVEVGLGLIAAMLDFKEEHDFWEPSIAAFAAFEPFERLDQERMYAFVQHLSRKWLTHGCDDRRRIIPFIARFPHHTLLEELNARVFERDDKHKYGNRVKETICEALSYSNAPLAWYFLWKMSTNQTGFPWQWSAQSARSAVMKRLKIRREEDWRELAIPTFGIDAKQGFRDLDYGSRTIRVRFRVNGLEFTDLSSGKSSKSLPRANKNDDTERFQRIRAEYNVAKKGLKEGTSNLTGWFEARMHKKDAWPGKFFRRHLLAHPASLPLLRGLVLAFTFDGADRPTFARIDADGSFIDLDFDPVDITDAVEVQIPTREALGQQASAWIKHMVEFQVIQPFEQLGADDFEIDGEHTRALLERIATGNFLVEGKTIRSLAKKKLAKITGHHSYTSETSAIVFDVSPHTFQLIFEHHPLYMAWNRLSSDPIVAQALGVDGTRYKNQEAMQRALAEVSDEASVEFLRFIQKVEHQPSD